MSSYASPAAEPVALLDLVDARRWQRLQDHLSGVLSLAIRTVSPSQELLTTPSWPSGLVPEYAIQMFHMGDELERLLPPAELPKDISTLTTPLGVTYAAVPIRVTAQQVAGYFIAGPIVVGPRENELQFRQRIEASGADAQALWNLLLSLKLYTFSSLRAVLNLMEEVGTSLAQFAYQAKQLCALVPASARLDQAVAAYYTERVLHSLLEAATLATHADGGSVMLYDPSGETLTIQAAEGLAASVIASTRLKRGEGLAGLAAVERSILLVDGDTQEERVKRRMQRAALCSSLIAPLIPDATREPIGVLNLRTSSPEKRFTKEHVELLKRLLDIAGVALNSLRATSVPS